jgi:ABC-type polysaccharide/polyol phosphate transport system ATPase subunit
VVYVNIKNLTVNFTVYKDKFPSFKDYFLGLVSLKRNSGHINFKALNNISLEINKGDRIGFVGHNGAGKSTLLKTICKIYEPEIGTVSTKGTIAPLLEIGAGFHPEYSGRENIHLNWSLLGYDKKSIKKYERKIIEFAEIDDFIDTPIKYYSTGMCLRLGFSIATAIEPDILIMDEMFAGGDAEFHLKATKRLEELIKSAGIMIFVSHDLNLINKFCNKVAWIEKGCLKVFGETSEVLQSYNNKNLSNIENKENNMTNK